jgi:hypothetical protein
MCEECEAGRHRPALHSEDRRNGDEEKNRYQSFRIARDVPVVHHDFLPFTMLDGAAPAKVYNFNCGDVPVAVEN